MRVLLAAIVLIAVVIFNFSATETRFECKGEISAKDARWATDLYLKLEQYRWWIGLWSDSEGNLKTEIPGKDFGYYAHLREAGDLVQIYSSPGQIAGHFSMLSKALSLTTSYGIFEGRCQNLSG